MKMLTVAAIGVTLALMVESGETKTLSGTNYVGGAFSTVAHGKGVDSQNGIEAIGNINLTKNIDFNLNIGHLWLESNETGINIDNTLIGAHSKLIWLFKPNEKINPFLGASITFVESEAEISAFGMSTHVDDSEVGFGGEGGIEVEVTENIISRLTLSYLDIYDEGSFHIKGLVGYWFNEQILGFAKAVYDFESETSVGKIGLIFKF